MYFKKIIYISILFLFCGCTTGSFFHFLLIRKDFWSTISMSFFRILHLRKQLRVLKLFPSIGTKYYMIARALCFSFRHLRWSFLQQRARWEFLESSYRFKTTLSVDTLDAFGTAGKIYLKGYGDPELHSSDLDTMAAQLVSRGVTSVRDGICTDASFFDDQQWGMGWMWDDEPDPDEACISALSVNKNCIEVRIQPSFKIGDPAVVTINPVTAFVQVLNSSSTTADSVRHILKNQKAVFFLAQYHYSRRRTLVTDTPGHFRFLFANLNFMQGNY